MSVNVRHAFFVGVSMAFPIYLVTRERHLAKQARATTDEVVAPV